MPDEAGLGADAGDVDDAAGAVGGEVGLCGLQQEERAAHVDVVPGVEVGGLDGGEEVVDCYAGVVDDDVEGEGVPCCFAGGFGGRDELRGAGQGAHVGLDYVAGDAVVLEEFGGELMRAVFGGVGGVV